MRLIDPTTGTIIGGIASLELGQWFIGEDPFRKAGITKMCTSGAVSGLTGGYVSAKFEEPLATWASNALGGVGGMLGDAIATLSEKT